MTISYTLQPIPQWYFPNLLGVAAAGARMFTFSSLNPSQFKPVFQDPAGMLQYPNPVVFNANGTSGPFYWQLDSDNPDDLYFIRILDNDGNLLFEDNTYPISGGGSGGSITLVQNIENIIINNSFLYNIGSTSVTPVPNGTFLAPGSHSNLFYPDINYISSGTSNANDSISFQSFPVGTNPIAPDFAPPYYLNYTCLNNSTGDTLKGIRLPITPYVNTVANQIFTFTFQARANSGADQLNVQLRQYFGSGGTAPPPSSDQITLLTVTPITLTPSFVMYNINFSIPTVLGKNLSTSNDDGTYIEILLPTNSQTNIDIAKPSLYVGSLSPNSILEYQEEIEAKIETPRTGDVKPSVNPFGFNSNQQFQNGWIPLNDGTIGNSLSNATTRAKPDTWLLYQLLFNNTAAADCPLFNSVGSPISKSGTALFNWNNNNALQLPLTANRVLVDRGTNALGNSYGEATHTLEITEIPNHNHPGSTYPTHGFAATSGTGPFHAHNTSIGDNESFPLTIAPQGGGQPHNNIQPSVNYNMIIKL